MNILGLDTSFAGCSVAVGTGFGTADERIRSRFEPMPSGQAERLMPMIDEVLRSSGLAFADLDRIAVATGPGTFTGMRIAIAAARAFALALDIPIVAFSSLAVIAMRPEIRAASPSDLAVAMDARRDEVYFELFPKGGAGRGPELISLAAAASAGGERPLVLAGSAAERVAAAARAEGRDATAVFPDALPHMEDALRAAAAAVPVETPPRPLYLRPPDAKPQDGKTLARAP